MTEEIENQVAWSVTLDIQPEFLLAVDGLLFAAPGAPRPDGASTAVIALDLQDGSLVWRQEFPFVMVTGLQSYNPDGLVVQRTAVSQPLLFLATASIDLLRGEGSLAAISLDGQERWRWTNHGQSVSQPAVGPDRLAMLVGSHQLVVLDPTDGRQLLQTALDTYATLAAPLLREDGFIVPTRGPDVLALDIDGRVRWRFTAEQDTWLDRTPLAVGQLIITTGSNGVVYALRQRDGVLAWQQPIGPSQRRLSPPISNGERVFVGAVDGLYALSLADGRIDWYFATERTMEAAPVLVGDTIYATCHDHHLYAIATSDGTERWRYRMTRRIEVGPTLAMDESTGQSLVIVADRGGTVTAVFRTPAGVELQATGQWEAAVTAFATEGHLDRAAALSAALGQPQQAAQLWQEAGRPEQAAEQYAAAGDWLKAANAWSALERPRKQADALIQHANAMTGNPAYGDDERAAVWQQAAQLLELEGESVQASECWLEVTQYRHLPVITVDVDKHDGLILDGWTRLQFIVRNDGFGIARNIIIRASGSQFKLEESSTRQFVALRPDSEQMIWLAVQPCGYGDAVPLRVTITYQDKSGAPHEQAQTVYLRVAQTESGRFAQERLPLLTGSTIPAEIDPTRLRQLLSEYFDMANLQTLCFDLQVDFEILRGETKTEKIMALILYVAREHRLEALLALCREARPFIEW
ncbi:MAG: PQQ-like beta-propeller repeat protein [Chloroflexi bacterium]|nr:PQQ-like beta-propeller repeat protein [Chloroflexota bacterium]